MENGELRMIENVKMEKNIIGVKSYQFAIDVARACRKLIEENREFILSKQLMRSGTFDRSEVMLKKRLEHAQ